GLHLHLDLVHVSEVGAGSVNGGGNTSGDGDVVLFDHDGIVQAVTVVAAAAHANGVLFEGPQTGGSLACVHNDRLGPLRARDGAGRGGGDPGEALREVERDPFRSENGAG